MNVNLKSYVPFQGKFDSCPQVIKYYSTPPHIYLGFQEAGLEQFAPKEALKKGTLWPIFYEYYENPYKK